MTTLPLALLLMSLATNAGAVEIHPENWKPCAVGKLSDGGGKSDWDAIPKWARAKSLIPYYGSPRQLAIHGLCNEKFKRVVLCAPNWDDPDLAKTDPAYPVCKAYFDAQGIK